MGKITVEYFISTFGTMNHPSVATRFEFCLFLREKSAKTDDIGEKVSSKKPMKRLILAQVVKVKVV